MEEIFYSTPFESYEKMVESINSGEAKFSFWRSAAYDVATRINPIAFFTYFLGFILSILVIVGYSIFSGNYWTLLAIPVLFFLSFLIHRMIFFVLICFACTIVLIFMQAQPWIISLFMSVVALYIGYQIWWAITTNIVHNELLKNEELFISMWKGQVLAIKDKSGNFFTCQTQ